MGFACFEEVGNSYKEFTKSGVNPVGNVFPGRVPGRGDIEF